MKRLMIALAVAVIVGAMLVPLGAQAQTVNRVVSQYFRWDQTESQADITSPVNIYSHTFFVPALTTGAPKYNVAYLSVHLVGDIGVGAVQEALGCALDGTAIANACPNGTAKTFRTFGLPYVAFTGGGDQEHDMSYTWCVPITTAGTHKFFLLLANIKGSSNSLVFAEAGMVNIELAKLPAASACTMAPDLCEMR